MSYYDDLFSRLNRETREYNNKKVNPTDIKHSRPDFNYLNNQTFHSNNGQRSEYYSTKRY